MFKNPAVALSQSDAARSDIAEKSDPPHALAKPRWLRWLRRGIHILGWIAVLAMGFVAVLRIAFHDGTYLLTCLNAFTFWLYVPAYACLAWAAWQRCWGMAVASAAVIACHVVWIAPDFFPAARESFAANAAEPSPTIRIFYANVSAVNRDHHGILSEIADVNPDIVVLVEYRWRWHQSVKASPTLADYPFGTPAVRPFQGEIAVFSKLPITRSEKTWSTGRMSYMVDVSVGSDSLRLFCLHAPRPMTIAAQDYYGYWNLLVPMLMDQPQPMVVVGDFNATQHSKVYRDLTEGGLRSAHRDRGRGYATTWPNGEFLMPPIRIDHALLSPGVECLAIAEGRGRGSDHKPLILDIRLRDTQPSPTGE